MAAPSSELADPARFTPELALLETPNAIAAYLRAWHGRLNALPAEGKKYTCGPERLHANTALVDAVLRRLFALAVADAAGTSPAPQIWGGGTEAGSLAIIATGGYGRRELAPFSDVDVTFVPSHEDDPAINAIIKQMFQSMMDVFLYGANLKVGYSYRLLSDLGQLDHQTQTALLDARLICGDESIFKSLRSQFRAQLLTAHFLFQKWAERLAVLEKQGGDTVYGVEPNVKEGAGGLRDIQTAEWIGEARYHVGLARLWPTLVERRIVSETDAAALLEARAFLLCVRCALHIVSQDARDVLTAEKQELVADAFGYPDTPEIPAVEAFMRDYYTQATAARRIARRVIARCLDSEIPLGLGLVSRRRALRIADREAAEGDVALPLHLAELAQAYGLETPNTLEEEIAAFLAARPAPDDDVVAGRAFTRLLAMGHGVAETLDRLEQWGVLAWLIPEFGPLMTLIPYDAAHDFTVGAHSLRVVRNLENLKSEADPKLMDYKRLTGEIAHPEALYLAGLIHDIGKQWHAGDHAETGAEAAARIAERFGWDTERRDKLVFLVRHHLLMAETSRLRDLALDETIREFTRQVPDMDALNMLYLLTYADTRAVGEGVWTEVTGRFLSELYYRAESLLSAPPLEDEGEGASGAARAIPSLARQRDRIRKQLARRDLPPDLIHEHTRNLPAQYLLNTPLEEMYLHIAMINRLRETFQPIVDFKSEYGAEYTEMILCAYDDPRPGLLAKITGVLYALDINIHMAQVFTREASVRIAIDTLWVDFRGKPLTVTKKTEVQDSLRKVLLGELGIGELLQQRKKPLKEQAIYSARIDDQMSERFSLLEVAAPDERGVVYRLTRAISVLGWNIHAARLAVWGSRARDAFYITDSEAKKIPAADVSRLLSALPTQTEERRKSSAPAAG